MATSWKRNFDMFQMLHVMEKVEELEQNQARFSMQLCEVKSHLLTLFLPEQQTQLSHKKSLLPKLDGLWMTPATLPVTCPGLDLMEKKLSDFARRFQVEMNTKLHFIRFEILCEIERRFKVMEFVDQSITESIFKVQEDVDNKMRHFQNEFSFLNMNVRGMQGRIVELESNTGSEVLIAGKNGSIWSEKEVEMDSQFKKMQEKMEDISKQIMEIKCEMKEQKKEQQNEEYCARLLELDLKLEKLSNTLKECSVEKSNLDKEKLSNTLKECSVEKSNSEKEKLSNMLKECSVETSISELKTVKVPQSEIQRNVLNEIPDLTWRIPELELIISGVSFKLRSVVFPLSGYPFGAQVIFSSEGPKVSILFRFVDLEDAGSAKPALTLAPRVHFLVRDSSGSEDPQHLVRSGSCNFGSVMEFDTVYSFRRFALSKSLFLHPSHIADDAVTVEMHVEAPHVANRVHSRDGTLSWTIPNYRKCVELERKQLVQYQLSPYFYTAARGYRVQAVSFLNGAGDNAGQGLSVGVSFLSGEFDHELTSLSPHSTTLIILDPDDPGNRLTKIVTRYFQPESASYIVDLWPHDVVQKYLVDDSLTLQVVIEA